MPQTVVYAIMLFGVAVAVAGLVLLFLREHDAAESSFELFGQKIRLTSTGLVVFIVGCGLVLMPLYLHVPPRIDKPRDTADLRKTELGIFLPQRIDGEEAEPNDTSEQANQIEIGQTYIARLIDPEDVDIFVFTLRPDGPTRLMVKALWHTVAEHVAIEMLNAYGRQPDGYTHAERKDHELKQVFYVEPDNAYYLTIHLVGAKFPFVYELTVSVY
jgi:hypothetical protein